MVAYSPLSQTRIWSEITYTGFGICARCHVHDEVKSGGIAQRFELGGKRADFGGGLGE